MLELNKIYNEDCLEGMKKIPDESIDAVITDPPYGIDYQSNMKIDKSKRHNKILNDKKSFTEFLPEVSRILKPTGCLLCFCRWDVQHAFITAINKTRLIVKNQLIWHKSGGAWEIYAVLF